MPDATETARSGRRRLPPDERRREILDAATRLIATAGFNGVSLGDIATRCGISKAGVLHHFPSKEHILTAVLERRDRLDAEAIDLSGLPARDAGEARAVLDRLVLRNEGQREIVRLYTVLSAEALDEHHPAHDYFRDRLAGARDLLARLVFPWHADPDGAAVFVLAVLDGLQITWLRDPGVRLSDTWSSFADHHFPGRENGSA
jgi:AcrR family transcriptional regulator